MVFELESGEIMCFILFLDRSLGKFVWCKDSWGLMFLYFDYGEIKLVMVNLIGKVKKLDVIFGG